MFRLEPDRSAVQGKRLYHTVYIHARSSRTLFTSTAQRRAVKRLLSGPSVVLFHPQTVLLQRNSCVTLQYLKHYKFEPISSRAARTKFSIHNSHQVLRIEKSGSAWRQSPNLARLTVRNTGYAAYWRKRRKKCSLK